MPIDPNIYIVEYNDLSKNFIPPKKRKTNFVAWGNLLMFSIQYLHDLFFTTYVSGFSGDKWDAVSTYAKGIRVRHTDHAVYEAIQAVPANEDPLTSVTYWRKVSNIWIGARERAKYNGQKIVLEWALNKWFDTTFRYKPSLSDIYLTNNYIDSGGFIVAVDEAYSSSIPKNEAFSDVGIGSSYSIVQNAFTIWVPVSVFTALSADPASREPIVRSFADKYVTAGINYDVQTY